jgi:hypothetical protein
VAVRAGLWRSFMLVSRRVSARGIFLLLRLQEQAI